MRNGEQSDGEPGGHKQGKARFLKAQKKHTVQDIFAILSMKYFSG